MWIARSSILACGLAAVFLLVLDSNLANGCPFCSAPSLTLSEQVAQADVVALVNWVSGTAAKISDSGSTEFEVVDVVRQTSAGKLAKGTNIKLVRYRPAKPGDQFLLFGTQVDATIEWSSPQEVSSSAYEYVRNSPDPKLPGPERLKYFVKYLETKDKFIADDAFGEFANAKYEDVANITSDLPREQLKQWLSSKEVSPSRMGLYGMMLGLCGQESDAELLEGMITVKTEDYRLGLDGIMFGYLMLTGEKGLALLEDQKLKNKNATFSETFQVMQAVRILWTNGNGRISTDRLRESMRILLDRPELADLVIADLSRMKDWSVQDKLMVLYDDDAAVPSVKRAIVRYMLTSSRDTGEKRSTSPSSGGNGNGSSAQEQPIAELPPHVVKAQKCLEELERKDPKTMSEAKRFFLAK